MIIDNKFCLSDKYLKGLYLYKLLYIENIYNATFCKYKNKNGI